MRDQFKDKNLLVLINTYRYGLKELINHISNYFGQVIIFVRINPLAEITNYISIPRANAFRRDMLIELTNIPENVTIFPVNVFYLPINWYYKRLGNLHFKKTMKILKKNNLKIDLIHAHFTWTNGYVGSKLKKYLNVPFILTVHENSNWFFEEYYSNNEQIYSAWREADLLIRVNKHDIPLLEKYNPNTIFIPNGYDPMVFFPIDKNVAKLKLHIFDDKIILFTLGNLIEQKGHVYLIDAMEHICKTRNDIILFIAGEGKLRSSLEKQIKNKKLEHFVKILGYVSSDEINYWMNVCDFFVLPSISESFGIVQLEAMACGKPIIATRNGGSEGVIVSDEYGFLVKPADSTDLAEKILLALKREWRQEAILAYARSFTWENIAKKLVDAYE